MEKPQGYRLSISVSGPETPTGRLIKRIAAKRGAAMNRKIERLTRQDIESNNLRAIQRSTDHPDPSNIKTR